jgi:hypothetical protein
VKQRSKEEDLIVRYLFGELTEEEQTSIEKNFLNDNAYFEEICSVEDALIDDYVQGALNEAERNKVESFLLASHYQRREIAFVRDIIEDISKKPLDNSAQVSQERTKLSGKKKSLLLMTGLQNYWKPFTFAALFFAVGVGVPLVIWNQSLQTRIARMQADQTAMGEREQGLQQEIEQQRESVNELARQLNEERQKLLELEQEFASSRGSSSPLSGSLIATLILREDSFTRGSAELPTIRMSREIKQLRIRIPLDIKEKYKSYSAVVTTFDGRAVWRGESAVSMQRYSGVTFRIDTGLLSDENYILTLKGETENGNTVEIGDYFFRVKR